MRNLVVGLGNEYAGDDAIGILAAQELRAEIRNGTADVLESAESGFALLDTLSGYDRVLLIDSIRTGKHKPGTILEFGFDDLGPVAAPSLHHAGLPELASAARRFGLPFPAEAVVLAVEVEDQPVFGARLSQPVAAALEFLLKRALARVELWESKGGLRAAVGS